MPRRTRKHGSPKRHLEALRKQEEKEKAMTAKHKLSTPLPVRTTPPAATAPAPAALAVITVATLAAELGAAHSTVQKRARALGAAKIGKTIILSPEQAEQIRAALADPEKPGPKPRALAEAE